MSGHRPWREIRRNRDANDPTALALDHAMDAVLAIEQLRQRRAVQPSSRATSVVVSTALASEHAEGIFLGRLRGYVEALGGELEISARFPGEAPIRLVAASKDRPS